jgi:signal transduction histidine kinase
MAVIFTVLLSVCALMLGWLLNDFSDENFTRETEAAIDSEIQNIVLISDLKSREEKIRVIQDRARRQNPLYYYQDVKGKRLAGNMIAEPKDIWRISEGIVGFEHDGQQWAAKIHTFEEGSRLLIARNIDAMIDSQNQLANLSILMIVFMLMVVCISFFLSYFVVSRINRIGAVAKEIIETGDLSRRVEIDSEWDDLSNLGVVLNILLGRVDELMQNVREVSDNIAHDLRTPLTRLRNHLELAAEEGASPKKVQTYMAEVDHLLNTFHSLLRIAKLEKGTGKEAFRKVDLTSILEDVVELYEPVAEEKSIRLSTQLSKVPPMEGDPDLLFQMLANLLDNALKFSPEKEKVTVQLSLTQLIICDNGVGLSDAGKERVFDRFYRADKSRNIQGNGLGLSLVKAVAELHDFSLELEDNLPKGLCVKVTFL